MNKTKEKQPFLNWILDGKNWFDLTNDSGLCVDEKNDRDKKYSTFFKVKSHHENKPLNDHKESNLKNQLYPQNNKKFNTGMGCSFYCSIAPKNSVKNEKNLENKKLESINNLDANTVKPNMQRKELFEKTSHDIKVENKANVEPTEMNVSKIKDIIPSYIPVISVKSKENNECMDEFKIDSNSKSVVTKSVMPFNSACYSKPSVNSSTDQIKSITDSDIEFERQLRKVPHSESLKNEIIPFLMRKKVFNKQRVRFPLNSPESTDSNFTDRVNHSKLLNQGNLNKVNIVNDKPQDQARNSYITVGNQQNYNRNNHVKKKLLSNKHGFSSQNQSFIVVNNTEKSDENVIRCVSGHKANDKNNCTVTKNKSDQSVNESDVLRIIDKLTSLETRIDAIGMENRNCIKSYTFSESIANHKTKREDMLENCKKISLEILKDCEDYHKLYYSSNKE
uniref:Uncharacterized protein n=1 Tax=Clastoptera arizonana TaxID=38151 RepID=A0A1B6E3W1_9HEMI